MSHTVAVTTDTRSSPKTNELKRDLGLFDSTMLVAGSMVGSGIFLVSAPIARVVGGAGWLIAAWVLAMILTVAAALSYGELAAMMPRAGGQYIYLKNAFSPLFGFLYGWTLFLIIQTGTIDAVAVGFARYLAILAPSISESTYLIAPIHLNAHYAISLSVVQGIAILLIALLTAINAFGVNYGKYVQNAFTVAKLAGLAVVIVIGLFWGRSAVVLHLNYAHPWIQNVMAPEAHPVHLVQGLIALAIAQVGALFAADAWNNITFTAGEVRNPKKNLPLALILGTGGVMIFYIAANLAYTFVLPMSMIANPPADRVGEAMMRAVFPGWGAAAIAVVILIAAFGCVNGMVLAGARTFYAMAGDGLFIPAAGRLNRARVPSNALWMQALWASILLTVRTYDPVTGAYGNLYSNLLDWVISAALLFYVLTIAAVFRLRKLQPEAERPYRTWGYPIVPAAYIVCASSILLVLFLYRPTTTIPGMIIIALGIPVYWLFRWKLPATGISTL